MRIGHVQSSRPQYYDRNAATVRMIYNASAIAPHGATVRATRTIAAGKKAYVEGMLAYVERLTAAAPVARARTLISYNGDASLQAVLVNNTVGANSPVDSPSFGLLIAGDLMELITQDLSTGGTCEYIGLIKLSEFDA